MKNPLIIATERMMAVLPPELMKDTEAIRWLGIQAASLIDINECGGKGVDKAFGTHVAIWMLDTLRNLNDMNVEELPNYDRPRQIAESLEVFLEADFSTHLLPDGYETHKELLPYLVKVVLAEQLK